MIIIPVTYSIPLSFSIILYIMGYNIYIVMIKGINQYVLSPSTQKEICAIFSKNLLKLYSAELAM